MTDDLRDWLWRCRHFVAGDWWLTSVGQWLCERGGHKPGVWWFNPGHNDPDMHCKRCGRNLA